MRRVGQLCTIWCRSPSQARCVRTARCHRNTILKARLSSTRDFLRVEKGDATSAAEAAAPDAAPNKDTDRAADKVAFSTEAEPAVRREERSSGAKGAAKTVTGPTAASQPPDEAARSASPSVKNDEPVRDVLRSLVTLLASGMRKEAENVLPTLKDATAKGIKIDASCLDTAIAVCARADMMDKALDVLKFCAEEGVKPSLATYNLMALGYGRLGDHHHVASTMEEMLEAKIRPDLTTYHCALMGAGRAKQARVVDEIWDELEFQELKKTATTYTVAIAALAKCADAEAALKIFTQMKDVEPDAQTYQIAMFACGKANPARWGEAIDLLRAMQARGISPDVLAYNQAIYACGKALQFKEAEDLLREMLVKARLRPDNATYVGLLKGAAATQNPERVMAVYQDFLRLGLQPDTVVATALMETLARVDGLSTLWDSLEQLRGARRPNMRVHLGPVVRAYEAIEVEALKPVLTTFERL